MLSIASHPQIPSSRDCKLPHVTTILLNLPWTDIKIACCEEAVISGKLRVHITEELHCDHSGITWMKSLAQCNSWLLGLEKILE